MIYMLYLMTTHSSQMINYSAAKFTHFHAKKSSRTFMQWKSHAHGKSYGWFMVLVRQFLILWFWSMVLHPKELNPSIGFEALFLNGFGPWFWVRPSLYKGKEIIWLITSVENLKKSKIWISDNRLVRHSWIWIKEKPEHYKSDLLKSCDPFDAWTDLWFRQSGVCLRTDKLSKSGGAQERKRCSAEMPRTREEAGAELRRLVTAEVRISTGFLRWRCEPFLKYILAVFYLFLQRPGFKLMSGYWCYFLVTAF